VSVCTHLQQQLIAKKGDHNVSQDASINENVRRIEHHNLADGKGGIVPGKETNFSRCGWLAGK
jgi:hypothetical protein